MANTGSWSASAAFSNPHLHCIGVRFVRRPAWAGEWDQPEKEHLEQLGGGQLAHQLAEREDAAKQSGNAVLNAAASPDARSSTVHIGAAAVAE
jgi:hypothetical protein